VDGAEIPAPRPLESWRSRAEGRERESPHPILSSMHSTSRPQQASAPAPVLPRPALASATANFIPRIVCNLRSRKAGSLHNTEVACPARHAPLLIQAAQPFALLWAKEGGMLAKNTPRRARLGACGCLRRGCGDRDSVTQSAKEGVHGVETKRREEAECGLWI
jgi:hypothetical protein